MGNVVISPNLKKERVNIDADGNIVKPFTNQIIQKNVPDFVPTAEDIKATQTAMENGAKKAPESPSGGLGDIIRSKVQDAVKAELSKIDIGSMVAKAISDALK